MLVTLDVSRLSGWLNAFASCAESKGGHEKEGGVCVPSCSVPSRKGHEGHEVGRQTGGSGAVAAQAACKEEGPTGNCERRAREELTSSIASMFVTPEVLQLDMSALKFRKSVKSSLMSVMSETSQVSMGPYVALAEVTLALYFSAAVLRTALLVKTFVCRRRPLVGSTGVLTARSTGSHCGGHAIDCSTSGNLPATLGLVMRAAEKAAATPMRTIAWKRKARSFAYVRFRRLAVQVRLAAQNGLVVYR